MDWKVAFYVVVLLVWVAWTGAGTVAAVDAFRKIRAVREVDSPATFKAVCRAASSGAKAPLSVAKVPFDVIVKQLKQSVRLDVTFDPRPGFTFTVEGAQSLPAGYFDDRRQYGLVIANHSKETLRRIELRAQFPYPIERHEVVRSADAEGIVFKPCGTFTATSIGGGSITMMRKPMTSNYEFTASELRADGSVEILLVLNSGRDPRGKTVPPQEQARYWIPETGPELTYIHGHFETGEEEEEATQHEFYAPLELREDRVVVLGSATKPEHLAVSVGME